MDSVHILGFCFGIPASIRDQDLGKSLYQSIEVVMATARGIS